MKKKGDSKMKLDGFGIMAEPWGQRICCIADQKENLVKIGSFEKGGFWYGF